MHFNDRGYRDYIEGRDNRFGMGWLNEFDVFWNSRHLPITRYVLLYAFLNDGVDVIDRRAVEKYWKQQGMHNGLVYKVIRKEPPDPEFFELFLNIHTELIDSLIEGGKKGFRDKYKELSGW